jgi:hypothetical protein
MARRHVSSVAEVVTGRLYWASGAVRPSGPHTHIWDMFGDSNAPRFAYWNFFLDFGPLNLGQLYRFCQIMSNKLRDRRYSGERLAFDLEALQPLGAPTSQQCFPGRLQPVLLNPSRACHAGQCGGRHALSAGLGAVAGAKPSKSILVGSAARGSPVSSSLIRAHEP